MCFYIFFFFSSRRRHTSLTCDWSSDVCSSDLPGVPIPPFVTRITGINAALVRGRPSFDSLLPDLRRLFDGAVVVAHNASFDCNFLSNSFRRAGLPWDAERLCTLRLARRLIPGLHSYRLDSLCAFLGFSF